MDEIKYGKFEMISAAASVPDLRNEPSDDTNANGNNNTDDVLVKDKESGFKLTYTLVISMALSQMPAVALGIFGVIKAFMNHGASAKAIMDCLR